MSDKTAIAVATSAKIGAAVRGHGRDWIEARTTATPIIVQEMAPGGPIRPGTSTREFPHPRPERKRSSMPRLIPLPYWKRTDAPIAPTTTPSSLAALMYPADSNSTAHAAATTAIEAFGWIEMPAFVQSARRGASAT